MWARAHTEFWSDGAPDVPGRLVAYYTVRKSGEKKMYRPTNLVKQFF